MRYGIIFTLAASLFAVGCGGEQGVAVHPVKGKLTIGGKTMEGIQITFQPVGEGEPASGQSQADGTYVMYTGVQGREGCPAGKYKVVLTDPGGTDYMDQGGASGPPPDTSGRIPKEYVDSPKEVEVKAGDNTIDLEI